MTQSATQTASSQGPSLQGYRIAIDVGGTFVDFVLLDEATGEITIDKQPSTAERIIEEVAAGLSRLPVALSEVGRIFLERRSR
jgi:N-methylhydantoinase A